MKRHLKLKSLLLLMLFTFFVDSGFSQETRSTGDADLSQTDVETLKSRLYQDPEFEGAGQVKPKADISIRDSWALRIKWQKEQNSCQSFAVSYAIDILDRKNYHSPEYLWDILNFNRLQNKNNPDFEKYAACADSTSACLECSEGISIVTAMDQGKLGLPFEDDYISPNLCGKVKPKSDLKETAKFKVDFIWFNKNKYPPDFDYPVLNREINEAVETIKEKISNGLPVIVSIRPTAFSDYGAGVHFNNNGLENAGGWHAMTVVGYDNSKVYGNDGNKGAFKIANSWNTEWGEKGYLWISYEAFKKLTRLIAFMSPDLAKKEYSLPQNLQVDGNLGEKIKPNSRIGVYQIELVERANSDTAVCLDANDWYPKDSNFQIILYKCHEKEKLKESHNQKWDFIFKEQKGKENYYMLKSLSIKSPGKVLAIRDGKLILEDQKEDFDENQLWLIKYSPVTERRAIVWAGNNGEFILQADENKLKEYTDKDAPEASVVLETFNNLPKQTWNFRCVEIDDIKCPPQKK